jgi:hypothetical protein
VSRYVITVQHEFCARFRIVGRLVGYGLILSGSIQDVADVP